MTHQRDCDLVIETIDPPALQALCGRRLARYKRPATIVVVDAIPKNPVGKTDKKSLRASHCAPASTPGRRPRRVLAPARLPVDPIGRVW
jgi:acyl-CoA synthetase (AMP-forming)/AMP-acid ligase II